MSGGKLVGGAFARDVRSVCSALEVTTTGLFGARAPVIMVLRVAGCE